jgi:hypothetical protein
MKPMDWTGVRDIINSWVDIYRQTHAHTYTDGCIYRYIRVYV